MAADELDEWIVEPEPDFDRDFQPVPVSERAIAMLVRAMPRANVVEELDITARELDDIIAADNRTGRDSVGIIDHRLSDVVQRAYTALGSDLEPRDRSALLETIVAAEVARLGLRR